MHESGSFVALPTGKSALQSRSLGKSLRHMSQGFAATGGFVGSEDGRVVSGALPAFRFVDGRCIVFVIGRIWMVRLVFGRLVPWAMGLVIIIIIGGMVVIIGG